MKYRILLTAAFCAGVHLSASAGVEAIQADSSVTQSIALLERWIVAQMAYRDLPGLAIGVVYDRDVVWALSVSGSSPNIIAAVEVAQRCGARVIGFTGRRGRQLAEHSSLCLVADHDDSGRVQETHQLAYHLICDRIEQTLATAERKA